MKMGGPWDSTFEPLFNQPDNEISEFVLWLAALEAPLAGPDKPMVERIMPQPLCPQRQQQIARIAASLLARSPCVRHLIKLGTEYFRGEFGMADPSADKTMIATNQRGLYDAYRKCMESSGRWAVLFSDEKEFIAGDGFLHNFPASQGGLNSGRKLVLPILPTAAIIYMLPMQYPSQPRLVTLRLSATEVGSLNDIVQVYASNFLFYREERRILSEDFRCGAHRQFQYNGHTWLDRLLDDLSQYNRWGEGGSAGMCSRRPYTEALEGNRWLDKFAAGDS
jgi:hypothetical protein